MNKRRTAGLVVVFASAAVVVVVIVFFLPRGPSGGPRLSIQASYVVGQVAEADGIQLSVLKSYESRGTDSERPRLRFVFALARVSVTNNAARPFTVKREDFNIVADGLEIAPRPLSYVMDSFAELTVQNGKTVEGVVSWEIPANTRQKYLVYRSPSGEQIVVDLKKTAE